MFRKPGTVLSHSGILPWDEEGPGGPGTAWVMEGLIHLLVSMLLVEEVREVTLA